MAGVGMDRTVASLLAGKGQDVFSIGPRQASTPLWS